MLKNVVRKPASTNLRGVLRQRKRLHEVPPGLKFSSEIEHSKRATLQGRFLLHGILKVDIENFKRGWSLQARLKTSSEIFFSRDAGPYGTLEKVTKMSKVAKTQMRSYFQLLFCCLLVTWGSTPESRKLGCFSSTSNFSGFRALASHDLKRRSSHPARHWAATLALSASALSSFESLIFQKILAP